MPAQARGEGSEIRVTVGVETDELGVEDHAVPAHGLADGGELGELAGGVSTGARPQREPSAFDADLGTNSVPFHLEYPQGRTGRLEGGRRASASAR